MMGGQGTPAIRIKQATTSLSMRVNGQGTRYTYPDGSQETVAAGGLGSWVGTPTQEGIIEFLDANGDPDFTAAPTTVELRRWIGALSDMPSVVTHYYPGTGSSGITGRWRDFYSNIVAVDAAIAGSHDALEGTIVDAFEAMPNLTSFNWRNAISGDIAAAAAKLANPAAMTILNVNFVEAISGAADAAMNILTGLVSLDIGGTTTCDFSNVNDVPISALNLRRTNGTGNLLDMLTVGTPANLRQISITPADDYTYATTGGNTWATGGMTVCALVPAVGGMPSWTSAMTDAFFVDALAYCNANAITSGVYQLTGAIAAPGAAGAAAAQAIRDLGLTVTHN